MVTLPCIYVVKFAKFTLRSISWSETKEYFKAIYPKVLIFLERITAKPHITEKIKIRRIFNLKAFRTDQSEN